MYGRWIGELEGSKSTESPLQNAWNYVKVAHSIYPIWMSAVSVCSPAAMNQPHDTHYSHISISTYDRLDGVDTTNMAMDCALVYRYIAIAIWNAPANHKQNQTAPAAVVEQSSGSHTLAQCTGIPHTHAYRIHTRAQAPLVYAIIHRVASSHSTNSTIRYTRAFARHTQSCRNLQHGRL